MSGDDFISVGDAAIRVLLDVAARNGLDCGDVGIAVQSARMCEAPVSTAVGADPHLPREPLGDVFLAGQDHRGRTNNPGRNSASRLYPRPGRTLGADVRGFAGLDAGDQLGTLIDVANGLEKVTGHPTEAIDLEVMISLSKEALPDSKGSRTAPSHSANPEYVTNLGGIGNRLTGFKKPVVINNASKHPFAPHGHSTLPLLALAAAMGGAAKLLDRNEQQGRPVRSEAVWRALADGGEDLGLLHPATCEERFSLSLSARIASSVRRLIGSLPSSKREIVV